MEDEEVQQIVVTQPDKRGFKHPLVATVFTPVVVVVIHHLPADAIPAGIQVVPLHASMEHFENVVEDFVGGDDCIRTPGACRQVRFDVPVEVFPRYLLRQFVVQW